MFSVLLRSEIFHLTLLQAALTLSIDRLEHYWLTSETALGFWQTITHVQRGRIVYQVLRGRWPKAGPLSPPKDRGRYGIGQDILYVLYGVAVDTMEAGSLKRKLHLGFIVGLCWIKSLLSKLIVI